MAKMRSRSNTAATHVATVRLNRRSVPASPGLAAHILKSPRHLGRCAPLLRAGLLSSTALGSQPLTGSLGGDPRHGKKESEQRDQH